MADSNRGVRFIRVRGRVIPIRDKDPSAATREKLYKKHGDGARLASKIDSKYERKAEKGTGGYQAATALGATMAVLSKGKMRLAAGAFAVAAATLGTIKQRKQARRVEVAREREYVRKTGYTSDGMRPSKNKTGV